MAATLEQIDIFQTAFVVLDVDDYLDTRRPEWIAIEQVGGVVARDRKVYVSPDFPEVMEAVSLHFPRKYAADGRRL